MSNSMPLLDPRVRALLFRQETLGATPNHSVGAALMDLHRRWEEAGGEVPPKAEGDARFLFELSSALFDRAGPETAFSRSAEPEALRGAYHALEARFLAEDAHSAQLGRGAVVSGIRHQVLFRKTVKLGADEVAQGSPIHGAFKAAAFAYRDVPLEVYFPPIAPDAHLGVAKISRAGDGVEGAFLEIPVAEITGYRERTHSIEALGRLHRFSARGRGQVLYGNWFSADGQGRELAAAMVAGLVVRNGPETENGMGGVSPNYALTPEGQRWVIQQPKLSTMFDHYNMIETCTAYLEGSHGRVPFDTSTGAVLGLYGDDVDCAPLTIDIPNCAVEIQAGQTYDVLNLAYHALRGFEPAAYAALQSSP